MLADELGLVEADDGLGQCIVVRIAAGSDRADRAGVGQPLGVTNGQVLDAAVGMMD